MVKTRQKQQSDREKWAEQKRQQLNSPDGKEKARENQRRYQLRKKDEQNQLEQEVLDLRKEVQFLRAKCTELEAAYLAVVDGTAKAESQHQQAERSDDVGGGSDGVGAVPSNPDCQSAPASPFVPSSSPLPSLTQRCDELMQKPHRFPEIIGMDGTEFDGLVKQAADVAEHQRELKNETVLPLKYLIFIFFFWVHTGVPLFVLCVLFCTNRTSIRRYLAYTSKLLSATLESEIRWPDDEEWMSERGRWKIPEFLRGAVCCLDGKFFRVSTRAPHSYSGHHHAYGKNVLFITKFTGEIVWFSKSVWGAQDQREWNSSGKRKDFLGKNYGILADGGFTLNPVALLRADPPSPQVLKYSYTPIKRPKKGDLNPMEKRFNRYQSAWRVVVEQSFAQLTNRFRIFQARFPRQGASSPQFDQVLTVCVALLNRKIRSSPLRRYSWEPKEELNREVEEMEEEEEV